MTSTARRNAGITDKKTPSFFAYEGSTTHLATPVILTTSALPYFGKAKPGKDVKVILKGKEVRWRVTRKYSQLTDANVDTFVRYFAQQTGDMHHRNPETLDLMGHKGGVPIYELGIGS